MDRIYKEKAAKLARIMNTKSTYAVPVIKVILECFEIVFTETDLDRLLLVGEGEYTKEELAKLWNLSGAEFETYFEYILATASLWPRSGEGVYELSPIFPGWIELYASGQDSEKRRRLIKRFSDFENVLKMLNIPPVRAYMNHVNGRYVSENPGRMSTIVSGAGMRTEEKTAGKPRTIRVSAKLDAENSIMQAGDLYPMLDKHREHISVMNCFCRVMKKLDGGKCDYNMPTEGCIAVGRMSDMLVDVGISRQITYEEAVLLMTDMEKKGCIHTVYHYGITSSEDELVICNCCTDCCFLYGGYRSGALSQLIMKVYYRPQLLDENECIGCNKCGKFCPTHATWYDRDKNKLEFDIDKCIGCGQCVLQCVKPVREMVRDERNVFVKTPKPVKNKGSL